MKYIKKISFYFNLIKNNVRYVVIAVLIYGCASTTGISHVDQEKTVNSKYTLVATVPIQSMELPNFSITTDLFNAHENELNDSLKEIFAEFDIPMTMTPRVNYYLKYFIGNGKSVMQRWLDRSNKYMYLVLDTFQKENIPLDLVVLAFTESGFSPTAESHAGAVGMWQFMKSTGKTYGLEVNDWVDERKDFVKATVAAARHLNDLNKSFKDWYLALAAYNAGSGRISKATKAHNSRDYFKITTGLTLKLETRDYVPKYLAQLLIYKNMAEYGFTPPSALPLIFDTVEVKKQVNILLVADAIGIKHEDMQELNPELVTPMTPPTESYNLRVPHGKLKEAVAFLEDTKVDHARYNVYYAKPGELISDIATKYAIKKDTIHLVNSFPYECIYTNKILFIPKDDIDITDVDIVFAESIANLTPLYYKVQKGDSLNIISKKHNVPLETLVKLNPKVNSKMLKPGQMLVITQGGLVGGII